MDAEDGIAAGYPKQFQGAALAVGLPFSTELMAIETHPAKACMLGTKNGTVATATL